MNRRHHSLLYRFYLRSPLWRLRRRTWILQARGRCERCGSHRRLTIHHRTYQRLGRERRSDIAVLCWNCHRQQHNHARPVHTRPRWLPARRAASPARRLFAVFPVALLATVALLAAIALWTGIGHR
jgi:5-methylcytosine-specific restriction endonuclease McrA